MAANLSCLTGSSFLRRVLNSFVQPTHSGVPLLLPIRVMPYKKCLAASLCFVFVREHSCNPAPIEFLADVICYSMCFCFMLLPAWWYPFGIFLHQSHSLFARLRKIYELLYMPRQVGCEIWQNAMKWGIAWQNVARVSGKTTVCTTKEWIREKIAILWE